MSYYKWSARNYYGWMTRRALTPLMRSPGLKRLLETHIKRAPMKLEDCTAEDEARLLIAMIGQPIRSVRYQVDGAVESAYLELDTSTVELAAIEDDISWRISARVADSLDSLPPLYEDINDVGIVEAVNAYANASTAELLRLDFRLTNGRTLIAEHGGGDFVSTTLVDPPLDPDAKRGKPQ